MGVIYWIFILSFLSGCVFQQNNAPAQNDEETSIAMAYLQQKDFEKARMSLNKALLAHPYSAKNWDAFAYLEELSGNLVNAEKAYQYAVQLDSQTGDPHNNYGVFLCRHHRQRLGIQEILRAAQTPSYIYRASAYKNARLCALSIPDPIAARKFLQAEAQNDPNIAL